MELLMEILTRAFFVLIFSLFFLVSPCRAMDDDSFSFGDDAPPMKLKRLKRGKDIQKPGELEIPLSERLKEFLDHEQPLPPKYPPPGTVFDEKEESDSEEEGQEEAQLPPDSMNPFIEKGFQIKLLANVYLRRLHEAANIFLPHYTLTYRNGAQRKQDYFRTPKEEICVFASGGLQNTWEKTVAKVHGIFFGGEKIKIIRASWIQKYFYKKLKKQNNLEKEYRGRENELHSELYYDIFFRNFFLPELEEKGINPETLTVQAFTWWEVCNSCDGLLERQKNLPFLQNVRLEYQVAANRRYVHSYPESSSITGYKAQSRERPVWEQIWRNVTSYVQKQFPNSKAKRRFWTKTEEGLEVCKWMGQAFEENIVTLDAKTVKAAPKGDILKYYRQMSDQDTQGLKRLLDYLKRVNWDLSCWYKGFYPDRIQLQWKKYWRQVVVPHFDWEIVEKTKNKDGSSHCEMCGNTDVFYIYWVYHPKFKVSRRFLNLPEEEQQQREMKMGFTLETLFKDLPTVLQKKRKDSLLVGSECVKVLGFTRDEIKEWERKKLAEKSDDKWKDQIALHDSYDLLDKTEKDLKRKK
jgi:hypothetical protein